MAGRCYLIGAGPGDPGLLTLRALELIRSADVIVYDYLCNPELLRHARADAEIIFAGKCSGHPTLKQEETNALLAEKCLAGLSVARLKGGDPFVFGRGGEEAAYLVARGISFEIVPGVSSSIAAPAYAGIPVTHRDHCSAFAVVTGHVDPLKKTTALDYHALAQFPGTLVFLMGISTLREITQGLAQEGLSADTPAAVIQWGTCGKQKTVTATLGTLPQVVENSGITAPAVTVIGSVVRERETLQWFENKPLFGRRIVVTRALNKAGRLAALLRDHGAEVIEVPLVRIDPPDDPTPLRTVAAIASSYNWIVCASVHAAEHFLQALIEVTGDIRSLGTARLAAVGHETAAAFSQRGLKVDIVPAKATADDLAKALIAHGVSGQKILIPRGDLADDSLPQALLSAGAIVDTVLAYHNRAETRVPGGVMTRLEREGADWVTFTSASTAHNFRPVAARMPEGWRAASIGPSTSEAILANGWRVDAQASSPSIENLVQALLDCATIQP